MQEFTTVASLRALKPAAAIYEVKDALLMGGYVQVWPRTGTLSYLWRYRFQGKNCQLTVGKFRLDANGLAEARKQARAAQNLRHAGIDPAQQKRAAKRAALAEQAAIKAASEPPPDLVEKVIAGFLELHVKRNNKDWRETGRILQREIVSRFKGQRLSEVTSAATREMVREITQRGAPIMANRTLARFKSLCNWAVDQEIIAASPIDKVRPLTSEKNSARDRVLDDRELTLVWRAAAQLGWPYGPIMQLLTLTGQRRGEVANMTWGEIDVDAAVWTIPAARSKNGRAHSVALAPQVIAVLKGLPRFARAPGERDFVFSPSAVGPQAFDRAKRLLDREIAAAGRALPPWVVHDLRRSVASGMAKLGVQIHIIERCLNHMSGSFGGIVGVYQRHHFADEMRDAFTRWAAHVAGLVDDGATRENVIKFVAGGKQ